MTHIPLAYATETFMAASWSLSPASEGHPKRVREATSLAALRTLSERDDAIGQSASAYLGPHDVANSRRMP